MSSSPNFKIGGDTPLDSIEGASVVGDSLILTKASGATVSMPLSALTSRTDYATLTPLQKSTLREGIKNNQLLTIDGTSTGFTL